MVHTYNQSTWEVEVKASEILSQLKGLASIYSFLVVYLFSDRVSYIPDKPQAAYVEEDVFKLIILLPPHLKYLKKGKNIFKKVDQEEK